MSWFDPPEGLWTSYAVARVRPAPPGSIWTDSVWTQAPTGVTSDPFVVFDDSPGFANRIAIERERKRREQRARSMVDPRMRRKVKR